MELARSLAVALAVAALLWLRFDSQIVTPTRAPAEIKYALGALALVFGTGGAVMYLGGQPERATIPFGVALGLGLWVGAQLVAS